MINKIDFLNGVLSNIQFHISHIEDAISNTELYPVPENKILQDLSISLIDFMSQKEAVQAEIEALTNIV